MSRRRRRRGSVIVGPLLSFCGELLTALVRMAGAALLFFWQMGEALFRRAREGHLQAGHKPPDHGSPSLLPRLSAPAAQLPEGDAELSDESEDSSQGAYRSSAQTPEVKASPRQRKRKDGAKTSVPAQRPDGRTLRPGDLWVRFREDGPRISHVVRIEGERARLVPSDEKRVAEALDALRVTGPKGTRIFYEASGPMLTRAAQLDAVLEPLARVATLWEVVWFGMDRISSRLPVATTYIAISALGDMPFWQMDFSDYRVLFLPDRLVFVRRERVFWAAYGSLQAYSAHFPFGEIANPPPDAERASPEEERRITNKSARHCVRYGDCRIVTPDGRGVYLLTSRAGAAAEAAEAFEALKRPVGHSNDRPAEDNAAGISSSAPAQSPDGVATAFTQRPQPQRLEYDLKDVNTAACARAAGDVGAAVALSAGLWCLLPISAGETGYAGRHTFRRRGSAQVVWNHDPGCATNADVWAIRFGARDFCFLPDRLLVCGGSAPAFGLLYADIALRVEERVRTSYDSTAPSDAVVERWTYRYTRADGFADLRYSDNPKVPEYRVSELRIIDPRGQDVLCLEMTHRAGAEAVARAMERLRQLAPSCRFGVAVTLPDAAERGSSPATSLSSAASRKLQPSRPPEDPHATPNPRQVVPAGTPNPSKPSETTSAPSATRRGSAKDEPAAALPETPVLPPSAGKALDPRRERQRTEDEPLPSPGAYPSSGSPPEGRSTASPSTATPRPAAPRPDWAGDMDRTTLAVYEQIASEGAVTHAELTAFLGGSPDAMRAFAHELPTILPRLPFHVRRVTDPRGTHYLREDRSSPIVAGVTPIAKPASNFPAPFAPPEKPDPIREALRRVAAARNVDENEVALALEQLLLRGSAPEVNPDTAPSPAVPPDAPKSLEGSPATENATRTSVETETKPSLQVAPVDPAPPAWISLMDGPVRAIFVHLSTHGSMTEAEITAALGGGPRGYRKFVNEFDQYATHVPFRVRIEVSADGKRYVREENQ